MKLRTFAICAAIFSVFSLSTAPAHHSNAMYERDKQIDVTGTVREFQWTNPHVFIELVVDGPNGPANFTIECPTPGVLRSKGWKFNSLKPGDKVVAKVHPLRSGQTGGGLISITKDGVTLSGGAAYEGDKAGK
jgi:hypothetical protein